MYRRVSLFFQDFVVPRPPDKDARLSDNPMDNPKGARGSVSDRCHLHPHWEGVPWGLSFMLPLRVGTLPNDH